MKQMRIGIATRAEQSAGRLHRSAADAADDDDSDEELFECKMTCLCRRRRFVVTRVSL